MAARTRTPSTTRTPGANSARHSDLRDQHWSRTPYRSAYHALLGPRPSAPGDFEGARQYLARINAALDRGGWTKTERNRLYELRVTWERRARGQDARFRRVGLRPGRLGAQLEKDIRRHQRTLDLCIRREE